MHNTQCNLFRALLIREADPLLMIGILPVKTDLKNYFHFEQNINQNQQFKPKMMVCKIEFYAYLLKMKIYFSSFRIKAGSYSNETKLDPHPCYQFLLLILLRKIQNKNDANSGRSKQFGLIFILTKSQNKDTQIFKIWLYSSISLVHCTWSSKFRFLHLLDG